jgi:hypothetical protein
LIEKNLTAACIRSSLVGVKSLDRLLVRFQIRAQRLDELDVLFPLFLQVRDEFHLLVEVHRETLVCRAQSRDDRVRVFVVAIGRRRR